MSKKEGLLKAATVILTSQGIQDLTLDAVAKKANVSKGGLLYHFATKEALINEMLDYLIRQFDELVEQEIERAGAKNAPWLRAYVTVCTERYSDVGILSRALFALSASVPQFAQPVQQAYERWQHRAENDGIAPDVARLVRMAADGAWLHSIYDLGEEEKAQDFLLSLRKTMFTLIDNGVGAPV